MRCLFVDDCHSRFLVCAESHFNSVRNTRDNVAENFGHTGAEEHSFVAPADTFVERKVNTKFCAVGIETDLEGDAAVVITGEDRTDVRLALFDKFDICHFVYVFGIMARRYDTEEMGAVTKL